MIAKAGLGLVGLSAISVGGVALAKPHLLGMDYMPNFHTLSEDKDFSSASPYGSGTFGKKYGRYLVGVNSKNESGNTPEKTNEDWWEWALRRLRKTTKPKKFEKVDKGYGTTENEHLSQVCKAAYKLTDSTGFGTESDKFSKDDVWKYCSPGKLKTTSEDKGNDAYGTNTIGGDATNKTTLVSVKDSSNDWFWEIRNKDFWATSGDWSGKDASGEEPNKSIFKKHYEEKKSSADGRKTIKKLCEEAYKENKENGAGNKNNDDAKKFCSLEKTS